MPLSRAEVGALERASAQHGFGLDGGQMQGFGRYLDLLESWNLRTNLVAAKHREELLGRHLLDSLAAVPLVQSLPESPEVADVGSGGGLPGVPVAIACPAARLTLIEPRRKKANFLRSVARACSTWNIEVREDRVQKLMPAGFDAVLSRAAFSPADLPKETAFLLRPGGVMAAFATVETAPPQSSEFGLEGPAVRPYALAGHPGRFCLAVWRRSRSSN